MKFRSVLLSASIVAGILAAACDTEPAPEATATFALTFVPMAGSQPIGCTTAVSGLGVDGGYTVGLSDLRFYVSNLHFFDSAGTEVSHTLDSNEFQYSDSTGAVSLVDLTGNTEGSCAATAIAYSEGTARTHPAVTGSTQLGRVASVSFDVGVPQLLMKSVIANNTPEGAPSPLAEMYWSWATGYRHWVMNFTVLDSTGAPGDGYMHIGSRNCGPTGGNALSDRNSCEFVNTPSVRLSGFDLKKDKVKVDVKTALAGLDFQAPIYDPNTFEVIGQGPGVECHSSPMQPHCPVIFSHFGLDITTGIATAASDAVFSVLTP